MVTIITFDVNSGDTVINLEKVSSKWKGAIMNPITILLANRSLLVS